MCLGRLTTSIKLSQSDHVRCIFDISAVEFTSAVSANLTYFLNVLSCTGCANKGLSMHSVSLNILNASAHMKTGMTLPRCPTLYETTENI